jgi:protein-S-isoprenylcysteine O-methyltransferase Ste14
MIASEFEYRYRFWMILLVYVLAYSFYNVDNLNVLYALVPWNQGVAQRDTPVRILYAAAALVAAGGAILLAWSTAYRPPPANRDRTAFSIAGSFRYVRNPHCLSYFFLLLALGTFQSVLGFPVMLLGETILLLRLVGREDLRLEQEFGEHFRLYERRVPCLLPSLRPRFEDDGQLLASGSLGPSLSMGLRRHAACLRVHLKRSDWVRVRWRHHCVFAAAKACLAVLDSLAPLPLALLMTQRRARDEKHFPVDIPQGLGDTPVDTPQEAAWPVKNQKSSRAPSI